MAQYPPRLLAFVRTVLRTADMFCKKKVTRSAAALSFFLFMSVFPTLICLNWLVGTLHVDGAALAGLFGGFVPADTLAVINEYLSYIAASKSVPMLIGGLILMATTSAAAYRTVRGTMNDIYDQPQPRRGVVIDFFTSFAASFIFLFSVYVCIILLLTGNWFIRLLVEHLGVGAGLSHWGWLRFVVLFAFVLLMVYGLYRFSVPRERPRIHVFRGALIAALALVVVSMLFSAFISLSTRYSLVYGSLASLIILMLWLYVCCCILLTGGIVNAVLFRHSGRRKKKFPASYTEEEPEHMH